MSAIHWFEIAVSDIERATGFYSMVLGAEIKVMDLTESMGSKLGMIPSRGGIGGALVENSQYDYVPSKAGALVYLTVDDDMDAVLVRAERGGGKILLPKTSLGESDPGFTAWIEDTEGNRVGLYSTQ